MIYIGEVIKGKWNENRYIVLKKLGQGGIGSVYKVKDRFGNIKAIKISSDINSITREYEFIKKFKNLSIVPRVYELDDYNKYGERFHFFVLEYIDGYNLKEIMKVKDFNLKDSLIIAVIVLKNLKTIYDLGYIYGDIKLENIMIDRNSKKIYLIDFGGAMGKNLGIKEYTPTYNIFSWGLDSNDHSTSMIFSVNMLLTSVILKQEPSPLLKNIKDVSLELKEEKIDKRAKKLIIDGLNGRYKDINIYISDIKSIVSNKSTYKNIDIINFFFKGSILIFLLVLIICISIKWM